MNENKRADPKWEKLFNTPLSSFHCTAFIFHTKMQDDGRKILIHFGIKRSKAKVTTELCQHFGSDTITLVFNVQLLYFIHRCRIAREHHLFIVGSKSERSMSQLNFVNTLVLTR